MKHHVSDAVIGCGVWHVHMAPTSQACSNDNHGLCTTAWRGCELGGHAKVDKTVRVQVLPGFDSVAHKPGSEGTRGLRISKQALC